jgi:hypothetical protein
MSSAKVLPALIHPHISTQTVCSSCESVPLGVRASARTRAGRAHGRSACVLLNHQETKFRVYYLGVSRLGVWVYRPIFELIESVSKHLHTQFLCQLCVALSKL